MGRFYCDYCHLYLTPDAASVRKNHLTGRNHVKLVCDYYEKQAKEQGLWEQKDHKYQPSSEIVYKGIPGSTATTHSLDYYYKLGSSKILQPPFTLQGFPQPPTKPLQESIPETPISTTNTSILKVTR